MARFEEIAEMYRTGTARGPANVAQPADGYVTAAYAMPAPVAAIIPDVTGTIWRGLALATPVLIVVAVLVRALLDGILPMPRVAHAEADSFVIAQATATVQAAPPIPTTSPQFPSPVGERGGIEPLILFDREGHEHRFVTSIGVWAFVNAQPNGWGCCVLPYGVKPRYDIEWMETH